MRASPQRPGPSGSRVLKKRPSIPRLGDRLQAVFTRDVSLTDSTTHTKTDVSATLTSSNLDRLAKSSHSNNEFAVIDTLSVCSDEDVVLIGTSGRSGKSQSSTHLSSRSVTPRGDETPPTTLTGDDSYCSSDDEATLDLSTPVNDKTFFNSIPNTTYELGNLKIFEATTPEINCQSHVTTPFIEQVGTVDGPCYLPFRTANELSALHDPKLLHSITRTVTTDGIVPDADSLHGIVRGFLATGMKAKTIPPPTVDPVIPATINPITPDRAKPFWEPQRIFEFYIRGVLTPEKAKETAKRHGYSYAVPVVDQIEHLKQTNPTLDFSEIITRAATQCRLGDFIDLSLILPVNRQEDQHKLKYRRFMHKLATCCAEGDATITEKPLHIFVDMSNIHIGFCNSWKISQNIPVEQRVRAPAFSFKVLATIMERNRTSKKKVLASSIANNVVSRVQWPRHFIDAEQQGYKTSIFSRVRKVSPIKVGRRRKASPHAYGTTQLVNATTSGDESGEDATRVGYETRNGEQGVDEILHLNMMNSILDDMLEPGTMVLATGDAAQAEFSGGFLEYATRALSQGWNLELVTWKRTISSAWVDPVFKNKFEGRFRIIYLDDFLEELNADLSPSLA
ncbi:hypothetical protein F5Y08DRAFT_190072 [Xylaria arbuscula]|nr:hypothetical protein F5Y08DRAFT_190072 [Xylaria arbuscula]